MSDERQARRFLISGRVQGVGYRFFAQEVARRLGVAGYAKNLADGRVEVYVVGTPSQFVALRKQLEQGPRFGNVEHVSESSAEVLDAFSSSFSIESDF